MQSSSVFQYLGRSCSSALLHSLLPEGRGANRLCAGQVMQDPILASVDVDVCDGGQATADGSLCQLNYPLQCSLFCNRAAAIPHSDAGGEDCGVQSCPFQLLQEVEALVGLFNASFCAGCVAAPGEVVVYVHPQIFKA